MASVFGVNMKNLKTKLDQIFFYSDPHFGHKNVIGFCNRPFNDVDEMNEELIKRYNKIVPHDGIVIWVGDCFFIGTQKASSIMERLNGYKVLVRGNHDTSPARMYNMGFDFVVESMEMVIAGQTVSIKHFPKKHSKSWFKSFIKFKLLRKRKPRYFDKYPKPSNQWHIHGHTHSSERINLENRTIHVGVDANDYAPVSYRTIEGIINKNSKIT